MRDTTTLFLKKLREIIIKKFESYESSAHFEKKRWDHTSGGGGEIAVIRGSHFEKAAVNFSAVSGDTFPMADGAGPYFATGISLITHMANPHAPTVHMNIRYIEAGGQSWFGGGYDLTPMGSNFPEDTTHFHEVAKKNLDTFNRSLYPLFSEAAKKYFFIPHWKKERGVGGIFFDHYNSGNQAQDLALWQAVGSTFLEAICPIYDRRIHQPFTPQDRQEQLRLRGHYVEFNLLYDRGTKFGFASGGNPEAILCSLPPLVSW